MKKPIYTLLNEKFKKLLEDLSCNTELGMEGMYRIIIQGLTALDNCRWYEFQRKRYINAVIRHTISNEIKL